MVQDETKEAIEEALKVVKGWNRSWSPKVFFVDNCEEEILALEALFGKNTALNFVFKNVLSYFERFLCKLC